MDAQSVTITPALVECPRLNARLLPSRCIERHRLASADDQQGWASYAATAARRDGCQECELGAQRAGEAAATDQAARRKAAASARRGLRGARLPLAPTGHCQAPGCARAVTGRAIYCCRRCSGLGQSGRRGAPQP